MENEIYNGKDSKDQVIPMADIILEICHDEPYKLKIHIHIFCSH